MSKNNNSKNNNSKKRRDKKQIKVPYDGRVVNIRRLKLKPVRGNYTNRNYKNEKISFNSKLNIGNSVSGLEIKKNILIFGVLDNIISNKNGNVEYYIIKNKKGKFNINPKTIKKTPIMESQCLKYIKSYDSYLE